MKEIIAKSLVLCALCVVIIRLASPLQRNLKVVIEKIVTGFLILVNPVRDSQQREIEGPRWTWIDGQCIEKFLVGRDRSRQWRRYGPIYRIWSGTSPEIVITRPQDIRTFYSDSDSHNKARSSNAGWMFHQLLGDCMGLVNGPRWKRLRTEFEPDFLRRSILRTTPNISKDAKGFVEAMVSTDTESLTVRAATAVSGFPFFCTAEYLYGPLSKTEKELLWAIGQRSLGLMGYVLSGGLFRFGISRVVNRAATRDLDKFEAQWADFNHQIYRTRLKSSPAPPIVPLWQLVLGGEVATRDILHTLSEILFANLDVSTQALSWIVIFLASDETIQQQLREEIRSNLDGVEELSNRRNSLLHYSFLETLRLRPFTVFTIPESSPFTKVIGGYAVPPNTSVVIDTLTVNYNQSFWGEDCGEFRPSRFENIKATELRYNLFTFGFGTRKCLGQYFAESMMKLFIVHLLDRYQLSFSTTSGEDIKNKPARDSWVPISDVEIRMTKLK